MLGIATFAVLIAAFVFTNSTLDRGARERRLVARSYFRLLQTIGDLEKDGVGVFDISDVATKARWLPLRYLIGPGLITVVVLSIQVLTGIPFWIPAIVIGLYAMWLSLGMWLGLRKTYGDPEGEGSASEDKWELLGIIAKATIIAAGILCASLAAAEFDDGSWLAGILWSIAGVVGVTYCYLPVAWLERATRRRREVAFATSTDREATLFLRSFADDDFRLFTPVAAIGPRFRFVPGRQRFEEFVAANLTGTAAFIAIGRPGERTATLGASRTYWTDETWQDAVTQTAARTRALILMAGRTEGLGWEMQHLSSGKLLGKTLVLFPPGDAEGTVARYEFICAALGIPERQRLPEVVVRNTLTGLRFDENGVPIHYVGCGRDWTSYSATITQFAGTISGGLTVRPRHTLTDDLNHVQEPTVQARILLKEGKRHEARAVIDRMLAQSRTPRTLLSAAWFSLAAGNDDTAALALFAEAREAAPGDGLVNEVGAVLLDNRGAVVPDEIFWLLHPDRRPGPTGASTGRVVELPQREAAPFSRAMVNAEAALEKKDPRAALRHARDARQAVTSDEPTAVAYATVVIAQSLLDLGNVEEAESSARMVSSMKHAGTLNLGVFARRMHGYDILDRAYELLVDVAEARGDSDPILAALHTLREFRVDNSLQEQAAECAMRLAKQYLRHGDIDLASRWAGTAQSEYEFLGRVLEASEASRLVGGR